LAALVWIVILVGALFFAAYVVRCPPVALAVYAALYLLCAALPAVRRPSPCLLASVAVELRVPASALRGWLASLSPRGCPVLRRRLGKLARDAAHGLGSVYALLCRLFGGAAEVWSAAAPSARARVDFGTQPPNAPSPALMSSSASGGGVTRLHYADGHCEPGGGPDCVGDSAGADGGDTDSDTAVVTSLEAAVGLGRVCGIMGGSKRSGMKRGEHR
jgi:hypothetical protein